MGLTKLIFDYWKIWMTVPEETNLWVQSHSWEGDGWEGLTYYDGYWMTFWYALNHDWYKMNDRQYAHTGCKHPYEEPRDFEDCD